MALGLGTMLVVSRLLEAMVFEIRPMEPLSLAAAALTVAAATLVAIQGPVRRCLATDPARVLASE